MGTAAANAQTAKGKPGDVAARIDNLDQGLKAVQSELQGVGGRVEELSARISELAEEQRKSRENEPAAGAAAKENHEELRELLRGLYVESSTVKADLAQVRADVQVVNESVESYRVSSGVLVALVIVLQVIVVALAFRGRG